ncbi:hypothetical protein ABZT49_18665 [Methylobacterium sp. EM32]|uniref:hypothetical protein n=1 Tax=Methylobacterium sp. EM32 TaxID=3163481 RepID=UPI0033ADF457
MAKFSLSRALLHRPWIDEAKLDATTEEEIRGYQMEDGFDPDAEPTAVQTTPGPQNESQAGLSSYRLNAQKTTRHGAPLPYNPPVRREDRTGGDE